MGTGIQLAYLSEMFRFTIALNFFMINHISLSVNHPLHVAAVVAELWQGQVAPFPNHPGSYFTLALDDSGTVIEFLPKNTVLEPGLDAIEDRAVRFAELRATPAYTATHANITVPIREEEVFAIARREGWRAVRCNRAGFFDVIEFWIENEVLLEVMPPALVKQYRLTMQPEHVKVALSAAIS
jgi:hypothetical protein